MPNNYKKEKNQLFQSLLSRAKKKGYIHAATIIERFQKYDISENEKDDIFEAFHNEGVVIIFESAENDSDPSDYLDTTSYEDALLYDGRDSCYADEKTDENMDGTLLDILSDEDEPHTVLHSAELRREISGFLNKLKERERFVIISRYGLNGAEPRSLEDVGRELGLSRERVRIIEMNALKKIRKMPNIDGLYEYLLH